MTDLTIVAVINVDPSRISDLLPLFAELIAKTRIEAGCIRYDLHHDNQDPSRFVFYETWETRELWQEHMVAPHISAFQKASENMVLSAEIFEMTII